MNFNSHTYQRLCDVDGIRPFTFGRRGDVDIRRKKDERNSRWKSALAPLAVAVLGGILMIVLGQVGYTASYAYDEETSEENMLEASSLDFAALVSVDGAVRTTIRAGEENAQGFLFTFFLTGEIAPAYRVIAENVTGDLAFCDQLFATTSSPFVYDGPLTLLATNMASDIDAWTLEVLFADDTGISNGAECTLDVAYYGWHPDASEGEGYTDVERTQLTLVAEVDEPEPVVELLQFSAPASFEEHATSTDLNVGTTTEEEIIEDTEEEEEEKVEEPPAEEVLPEDPPEEITPEV